MTVDTLSEVLTRIRNALNIKRYGVEIPKTRITKNFSNILLKEGLIEEIIDPFSSVEEKKMELSEFKFYQKKLSLFLRLKYRNVDNTSVITNLQRVSHPGLRIYTNYKKIPEILGGRGLIILSTPQGLITDREARYNKVGGEILCSLWLFFYLSYESSFLGKEDL